MATHTFKFPASLSFAPADEIMFPLQIEDEIESLIGHLPKTEWSMHERYAEIGIYRGMQLKIDLDEKRNGSEVYELLTKYWAADLTWVDPMADELV